MIKQTYSILLMTPSSSPTARGAVAAGAPPPQHHLHQFLCADGAGIILETLGSQYTAAFRTVGFCQGRRPVQILSPFDVAPGEKRREFLDVFAMHEANGTMEQMPYLVYWFDTSLQTGTAHLTLEPADSILSYESGERLNYDQAPKEVTKKLMAGANGRQSLTASERLLRETLTAMERARATGAPPVSTAAPPEDELYKIVRASEMRHLPTPSSNSLQDQPTELTADSSNMDELQQQAAHPPHQPGPKIGDRVKVYWDDGPETVFHHGIVQDMRGDGFCFLIYDDEETQWLPLADHRFELVPDNNQIDSRKDCSSDRLGAEAKADHAGAVAAATGTNRKRKADMHGSSSLAESDSELDPTFKRRLDELKAYTAEHGHANVPYACSEKHRSLYDWVKAQRHRYKALPKRYQKYRIMTQAEIDALDAVGLDWKPCAVPGTDSNNDQTDVDLQAQQDPSGKRSKTSTFKNRREEEEKQVEEDDVEMSAIEPARSPSVAVNYEKLDPQFIAKMDSVRAHIAEHGHMNVYTRNSKGKSLYDWIRTQRLRRLALPNRHRQYRRISQAEIAALDAIGFDWRG